MVYTTHKNGGWFITAIQTLQRQQNVIHRILQFDKLKLGIQILNPAKRRDSAAISPSPNSILLATQSEKVIELIERV